MLSSDRTRRYLANTALLSASLLAALLLAEVALRIHNPIPMRVRGMNIRLRTSVHASITNSGDPKLEPVIEHNRNSLGFRGPEPPPNLSQTMSIIAVGGSTTECYFLSDSKTWPARLQQRLSPQVKPLWVNNAGLDGHSTIGHLALLHQYLFPLQPKILVFLVGINDVGLDQANLDDTMFTGHPSATALLSSPELLFFTLADHSEVLATSLTVFRSINARRRHLTHQQIDLETAHNVPLPTPSDIAQQHGRHSHYLEGFRQRLITIVDATRHHGIEPVLVTQPALYGPAVDPITHTDLATIDAEDHTSGALAWDTLEWYNDVTRKVAAQEHVTLADAAHDLPKRSDYFYDFVHYTNQGADRLAAIIQPPIETLIAHKWPGYLTSAH